MLEQYLTQINAWHWLFIAFGLLIFEALAGVGYLFWAGLSAAFVALLKYFFPDLIWQFQIIIFSISSIIIAFFWWRYQQGKDKEDSGSTLNKRAQQYLGREVEVSVAIEHGRGKVRVDDSQWTAKGPDLPVGTWVRVTKVEGMDFFVEKISQDES